jgi:CubicO group peptidase (beta-lactamase class C family)
MSIFMMLSACRAKLGVPKRLRSLLWMTLFASTLAAAQDPAAELLQGAPSMPATMVAADSAITPIAKPTAITHANDARVGDFVDGLYQAFKKRDGLDGLTIAITRRDGPILLRGFGRAKLASKSLSSDQNVDPQTSMFRIGSVSKLFTYLAAMQLVERGKLQLDAPVNSLLPAALAIPDQGFVEPILVKHLLHHNAGFEDSALGHLFADRPEKLLSLNDYLVAHRPNRVRPAGQQSVYSNYSVALLGAIIAQQSGQLFEDYAEQAILLPLGMQHTTFKEPLVDSARRVNDQLVNQFADGMNRSAGVMKAQDFEYIAQIAPAGSVASSAADMARFAQMYLRDGELNGMRVIGADTLKAMRSGCFQNGTAGEPVAMGPQPLCHGFMTAQFGAALSYGHGGNTIHFHSDFITIPDLDLAIFISNNATDGGKTSRDMSRMIIEFLEPSTQPTTAPLFKPSTQQNQAVLGDYLTDRRKFSGLEGLLGSLSGASIKAAPASAPEGSLLYAADGEVSQLRPVAAWVYQNLDTGGFVRFIANSSGQVQTLAGSSGFGSSAKVSGFTHPMTWIALFTATGFFAICTLISAYAGIGTTRRPTLGALRSFSIAGAVIALVYLACFAWTGATLSSNAAALFHFPGTSGKAFMAVGLLLGLVALIRTLMLPIVWLSNWRRMAKFGYILVTLTMAALIFLNWHKGLFAL